MKLAVTDPNFSIVVPTECNAGCSFCFWKPKKTLIKEVYLRKLTDLLYNLPGQFNQCSITGGEPTTLDWLGDIIAIARPRFKKIVMSSNGFDLNEDNIKNIDHLNISRHHYSDGINRGIFKTNDVPLENELASICERVNQNNGVDVTLNCVVSQDFNDIGFITDYINFAKKVNANAVCFRKVHSNLDDLPVEKLIKNKIISEDACPVCRSKVRYISGMKTTWKYNVIEPSNVMKNIYELIFQPDGKLTKDWKGEQPVNIKTEFRFESLLPPERGCQGEIISCGSTCGSRGC